MSLELFFQYLVAGITYGAVYAVVAIGFNIIYNSTGIINFAQGEFVMLGGMIAITFAQWLPLFWAIVAAVAVTMLIGALMELCCIRWLREPGILQMLIITIGVSILLSEAALHLWGEGIHSLPYFYGDAITAWTFGPVRLSPQVAWVLLACALMVLGLQLFFNRSPLGREMRACAVNRTAALLCGVKARNMVTLSFVLSAGMGALAGCMISPITYTQYDSGAALALKGFTAAIIGGLGNSMAAVAAGLLLGILEAFSITLVPLAFQDAVSVSLLLLILFIKPHGLFGSSEAARLKAF